MKYLGIDYGRKKIGLSLSTEGKLATPLVVLRVSSDEDALKKVSRLIKDKSIEQLVIGISEGKMAEETKAFAKMLQKKTGLKINFQDESLSTKDAQEKSISAGIKRKKRREMEDAYSASLILERYLDNISAT